MIVGNDISNAQGQISWGVYKDNTNFVVMKASEGSSYIDTYFGYNRQQARQYNIPRGFYHFARPELGNTPQQEAEFFCNLIDGDPIHEGEILVLDFEVNYPNPVGWCKEWLDYVSNHFKGVKPLIYLNQNLATSFDWTPVVDAGYGLWIAAYTYDPNNNTARIGNWQFAAMQQWTDTQQVPGIQGAVDGDVFFGDSVAFGKYGYHEPQAEVVPQQTEAPVSQPTQPTETPVIVTPTPTEQPEQTQTPVQQEPVSTEQSVTPEPIQDAPVETPAQPAVPACEHLAAHETLKEFIASHFSKHLLEDLEKLKELIEAL